MSTLSLVSRLMQFGNETVSGLCLHFLRPVPVPPTGERGATGKVASGPQTVPDLIDQIRSVRQSHSSCSLASLVVFSTEVSLLFCFAFYAADANNAQLSYVATAQSAS